MHNEEQSVVISWKDYYEAARGKFMHECCKPVEEVNAAEENPAQLSDALFDIIGPCTLGTGTSFRCGPSLRAEAATR